jgi:putative Ca2+/H+ antiporter (TMEM165/GDT1 family)
VNLAVIAICFPVIFIGELPDKTMFANLVLAANGRPVLVWLGAAAAFLVHVAIATTVGVTLFHLVPHRPLDLAVAALFLAGAAYAWAQGTRRDARERELVAKEVPRHRLVITAFVVIFVAEWGDLTQVLTANLAARYHAPLSVGVGALAALWAVAAIAVTAGQALSRYVDVAVIRKVTALALVVLAGFSVYSALR